MRVEIFFSNRALKVPDPPSEWSLHPRVAKQIFQRLGTPHIDLFAMPENAKLPVFVAPLAEPKAYAEDALAISWEGLWAYAYPPTSIMNKVLEKVLTANVDLILIAPAWPTQAWFPVLLNLSVRNPLRLPVLPNLLKQTNKQLFHSNPAHLRLHAWLLQNRLSPGKVSDQISQVEFWDLKESLPESSMLADGTCFLLGAKGNREIHSEPLFP